MPPDKMAAQNLRSAQRQEHTQGFGVRSLCSVLQGQRASAPQRRRLPQNHPASIQRHASHQGGQPQDVRHQPSTILLFFVELEAPTSDGKPGYWLDNLSTISVLEANATANASFDVASRCSGFGEIPKPHFLTTGMQQRQN